MAILFEGKKDLVDDVRLDRAEVIAAAAVDAAWGRRWCSRAVHHREYSICLTISVIPRDHPCIFLSIFIYYLFVLQVQEKYSHRTAAINAKDIISMVIQNDRLFIVFLFFTL